MGSLGRVDLASPGGPDEFADRIRNGMEKPVTSGQGSAPVENMGEPIAGDPASPSSNLPTEREICIRGPARRHYA